MRLHNKKTGEIVDVESVGHAESLKEEYGYQVTLSWKTEYENLSQCKDYHSLAELNEEWEDYKPAEPLIKDPKSRKVFQEWADLFGAEQFRVNHFSDSRRKTTSIGSTDSVTEPVIELPGHIGEDSEIYTKEELCGEEG